MAAKDLLTNLAVDMTTRLTGYTLGTNLFKTQKMPGSPVDCTTIWHAGGDANRDTRWDVLFVDFRLRRATNVAAIAAAQAVKDAYTGLTATPLNGQQVWLVQCFRYPQSVPDPDSQLEVASLQLAFSVDR